MRQWSCNGLEEGWIKAVSGGVLSPKDMSEEGL
jgi:hypothetical protein